MEFCLYLPGEVIFHLEMYKKNLLDTPTFIYIMLEEILESFGFNIDKKFNKDVYRISQHDIDRLTFVTIYSTDVILNALTEFRNKHLDKKIDLKITASSNPTNHDLIIVISVIG